MLEAPSASEIVTRPAPAAQPNEQSDEQQAERLTREIVARFARDPVSFATSRHAEPSVFVRDYLESLNRRLSDAVVVPEARPARAPMRLATLGPDYAIAPCDWLPPAEGEDRRSAPDLAPRMGIVAAIGAAAAVVSAVAAVVMAATALGLIRHKPV